MSNTAAVQRTITTLRAEGLSFPSCGEQIVDRLSRLPGVSSVRVKFASSRVEVVHDPAVASPDDLVAVVAKAGHEARPVAF